MEELLDLGRVVLLELEPGPGDALVEPERPVDEVGVDLLDLIRLDARRLGRLEEVGLAEVRVDGLGRGGEVVVEVLLGPLDRVLDLIREALRGVSAAS